MGFSSLPTEVLHHIFANFCAHCTNPEPCKAMPNFDSPVCRADKKALANACLINKSFHRIAQPILFHYCALNATASGIKADRLRGQLVNFLHSLYRRPDLATEVRALSFLPGRDWADKYTLGMPLRDTMRELGVMYHNSRSVRLGILTHLIMSLTLNTEYLRVTAPLGDNLEYWRHIQPLPRVKLLELVTLAGSSALVKQGEVFRVLCNLETMHIAGSSLLCEHHYDSHSDEEKACDHRTWHVLPSSLKRVVFDYVDTFRLPHLFDHCPQLQDLELFMIHTGRLWEDATPPNGALEETRHTLRRLVVSLQDWFSWMDRPGGFEQRVGPEGACYKFNFSFRNMTKLEFLGVDQTMLVAEVIRATGTSIKLSEALPVSLKTLHIGYVVRWHVLLEQLHDLYSAKLRATGALELTTVRFDPHFSIVEDAEEIRGLLHSVGIALEQGQNPGGQPGFSRQMLSPSLDGMAR